MEDTTQLHLDNPDSFDQGVIHRIVHSFYEKKEYPTVSGILEKVKEQCCFVGGDFACGVSFGSWDLATRNEMENNTFTNKET